MVVVADDLLLEAGYPVLETGNQRQKVVSTLCSTVFGKHHRRRLEQLTSQRNPCQGQPLINYARCNAVKVPSEIGFRTKGEIALELIDEGIEAGVPTRMVVVDAGYGDQPSFLDGLQICKSPYVVGVPSSTHFRLAEEVEQDIGDELPPPYQGIGHPRKPKGLEDRVPSRKGSAVLEALLDDAWRTVAWREGTKGALVKRCVRAREYRVGRRGVHLGSAGWLTGERPVEGHLGEPKYYER